MASSRWLGISDKMLEGGKGRWKPGIEWHPIEETNTILVALCPL